MRLIPVEFLNEEMKIAVDVVSDEGKLLLKTGYAVTESVKHRLPDFGVKYVYITDQYCFNEGNNKYKELLNELKIYVDALKQIAFKLVEGESDSIDLKKVTKIAEMICDEVLAYGESFKITYEPNRIQVGCIIERTIYESIMATVLGARMGLKRSQLVHLCVAGLLKDIALVTPKFEASLKYKKKHTLLAYSYLRDQYNLDGEILEGILNHHERCDGSGYPRALRGDSMGIIAKILGIIDDFFELKSSHDILGNVTNHFEKHMKEKLLTYDTYVLEHFNKNTDVFTIDSMVKLTNEEVGVIIANNNEDPFKPVIKIVQNNQHEEGEIIELEHEQGLGIADLQYCIS